MKCRYCSNKLTKVFIDLVNSPPSNSYLSENEIDEPEQFYPLKLYVCEKCFLVQADEYKKSEEIFNKDYPYFSSFSRTWVEHAKKYADMIVNKLKLNRNSFVVEIASNDGYLLQFFKEMQIPCLGIEPSANTAEVAIKKGIDVIIDYFSYALAKKLLNQNIIADLLIGNNVLAHVPNINDFVKGLKFLLKDNGVITMEFPHLKNLIENVYFDTIYHEHFSYFSFTTVKSIFEFHGLELFDVEEIPTHGGSLRIYAKNKEDKTKKISPNVENLLFIENNAKMNSIEYYESFQEKVNNVKYDLLDFLIKQKREGKKVAAYGAAAKGNTILNYCGIKSDLIEYVVDISPYKQGKYLPASHIPILKEEIIKKTKPDYIIILPWNIKEEIIEQLKYIREWNGKFVIPLPKLEIV